LAIYNTYSLATLHHERVPHELRDVPQWVLWMAVPEPDGKKPRKVPVYLSGKRWRAAQANRATTWQSYAFCARAYTEHAGEQITITLGGKTVTGTLAGIGYVFAPDGGVLGIDLDNCRAPDGTLTPDAQRVVDSAATYAEVSPSGTGVKLWLRGALPAGAGSQGTLDDGTAFEIYDSNRYFAFTTDVIGSAAELAENAELVTWLVQRTKKARKAARAAHTATPLPEPIQHTATEPQAAHEPSGGAQALLEAKTQAARRKWISERVQARLHEMRSAVEGTRHNTLMAIAGELLRYEASGWCSVEHELVSAARAAGLPEDEIIGCIRGVRSMPDFGGYDWHEKPLPPQGGGAVQRVPVPEREPEPDTEPVGRPAPVPPVPEREPHEPSAQPMPDEPDTEPERTRKRGKAQDTVAALLAVARDCYTFVARDTVYARLPNAQATVVPVQDAAFAEYLLLAYFREHGTTPPETHIKAACSLLAAQAREDGVRERVWRRVAHERGSIWLDLCDGNAVQITPDGWQVVSAKEAPNFLRSEHAAAMPVPRSGGSWQTLRQFVRCSDSDFVLMSGWLVTAFADVPRFVLAIGGESGAGKTDFASKLLRLVDKSHAEARHMPNDVRALAVAATNSHGLLFDNVGKVDSEISDMLCQMSTGGVVALRKLYSNADEQLLHLNNAIVLTGLGALTHAPDLADRTLAVSLRRIDSTARDYKAVLAAQFAEHEPELLGCLCDALAHGLREHEAARQRIRGNLPRMADATAWCEACLPALGFMQGDFLAAHAEQELTAQHELLAEPVPALLLKWLRSGSGAWHGPTETLHGLLLAYAKAEGIDTHLLPQKPQTLGTALNKFAPALRVAGVVIEKVRDSGARGWRIGIAEPEPRTQAVAAQVVATPPEDEPHEPEHEHAAQPEPEHEHAAQPEPEHEHAAQPEPEHEREHATPPEDTPHEPEPVATYTFKRYGGLWHAERNGWRTGNFFSKDELKAALRTGSVSWQPLPDEQAQAA